MCPRVRQWHVRSRRVRTQLCERLRLAGAPTRPDGYRGLKTPRCPLLALLVRNCDKRRHRSVVVEKSAILRLTRRPLVVHTERLYYLHMVGNHQEVLRWMRRQTEAPQYVVLSALALGSGFFLLMSQLQVVYILATVTLSIGLLVGTGIAIRRFIRYRLLHARAQRICQDEQELIEGAIALRGTVAYHADHPSAVAVRISQEGTEAEHSGSWTHTWTEAGRKTEVKPFRLCLPSGDEVDVEPPKHATILLDEISAQLDLPNNHRTLIAELQEHEGVLIVGQAEKRAARPNARQPYRDLAFRWKITGAPEMWIASESTNHYFRQRSWLYARHAVFYLALAFVPTLVTLRLFDRALGYSEIGTVSRVTRSVNVDDDGDEHEKYEVCIRLRDHDWCKHHEPIQEGTRHPVRRGRYSFNFGANVTMNESEGTGVVLAFVVAVFAVGAMVSQSYHALPWYRRRRYTQKESGRLPRNMPPHDPETPVTQAGTLKTSPRRRSKPMPGNKKRRRRKKTARTS